MHSKTKKTVASAARVRDKYYIRANQRYIDKKQVVTDFMRLSKKDKPSDSDPDDETGTITPTTTLSDGQISMTRTNLTTQSAETPSTGYFNSPLPSPAFTFHSVPSFHVETTPELESPSSLPSSILGANSDGAPIYELESPGSIPDTTPVSSTLTVSSQPSITRSPSVHSRSLSGHSISSSGHMRSPSGHRILRKPVPTSGEPPSYQEGTSPSKAVTPPILEQPKTPEQAVVIEMPSNSSIPVISEP